MTIYSLDVLLFLFGTSLLFHVQTSLRQAILTLFYSPVWLSNQTKVTQSGPGAKLSSTRAFTLSGEMFHFLICAKTRRSSFKAPLMKYSSLLPSRLSIQIVYSVTKIEKKNLKISILILHQVIFIESQSFIHTGFGKSYVLLVDLTTSSTKTKSERHLWLFYIVSRNDRTHRFLEMLTRLEVESPFLLI